MRAASLNAQLSAVTGSRLDTCTGTQCMRAPLCFVQVLRCHTSAHQAELLRKGEKSFLVTGDVYRRDSIDASHYPVFHQMEALYVLSDEEIEASGKSGTELASEQLKLVLSGLAMHLFGDVEMKFVDAYFPFTVSAHSAKPTKGCVSSK